MPFVGELRPYQVEAYEAMVDNGRALLAYDMGTGKTVVSIAAVERLIDIGKVEVCLVVVPSALKGQWRDQINLFAPEASVCVIDGPKKDRQRMYRRCAQSMYEYIILGYEQILSDNVDIEEIPYDAMVCDEATAIKSFKAQRSKAVKRMRPKYRFALSGQPVENRPEELFSIMQWVDATVLGNFAVFDQTFIVRNHWGNPQYYRNLKLLHRTVRQSGVILRKRRSDPDVAPYMPKVGEESIFPAFDATSRSLYNTIAHSLLSEIEMAIGFGNSFDLFAHYSGDSNDNEARGRIMSRMLALRMLCDHPDLLRKSADRFNDPARKGGSEYAADLEARGLLTKLPNRSPKIDVLKDMVGEVLEANPENKVVAFSSFRTLLPILEAALSPLADCVQFHGGMNSRRKDEARHRFLADPNCRVFLSSDAGGYGVDLPNANYLFNVDLPWSAGKLDQRNSRIIRASSKFGSVTLLNLLMQDSLEERLYRMLQQKRAVASAWLDGEFNKGKSGVLRLDIGTLREFIEERLAA